MDEKLKKVAGLIENIAQEEQISVTMVLINLKEYFTEKKRWGKNNGRE